jgi:hypothetical protein
MILEASKVRDRLASDGAGGSGCRERREGARQRERAHCHVLVEIPERVDGCHRKAGSGGRFGSRAGRQTSQENVHTSKGSGLKAHGLWLGLEVSTRVGLALSLEQP